MTEADYEHLMSFTEWAYTKVPPLYHDVLDVMLLDSMIRTASADDGTDSAWRGACIRRQLFWSLRRCQYNLNRRGPMLPLDAVPAESAGYAADLSLRPDAEALLLRLSAPARLAIGMHFSGASMSAIASAAGVSRSQAYRFVSNGLDYLLRACNGSHHAGMPAQRW